MRWDVLALLPGLALSTTLPDGRIPWFFSRTDFDNANLSPYSTEYVKGNGLNFSQVVELPPVPPSFWDIPTHSTPLEVTINDSSIFYPGGSVPQSAIRRAELMFNDASTANNVSTRGKKTLKFSIRWDEHLPLNLTHEYLMVFLETADYSADVIQLKTGTLLSGNPHGITPRTLQLLGTSNDGSPELFSTPFTENEWHNYAVNLDFDKNTVQVFYSTGYAPLIPRTKVISNNISGDGAYHFGLFKDPVNPGADSLRSGYQEPHIHEGIIYGGIHITEALF